MPGPQPQIGVDLEPAVRDDFARVEQVVRVEGSFDLAHHAQQAVAELLGHELRAGDADAVLAGQRAFERETSAETSLASWRNFFRSSAECRSRIGRTWSKPAAA